MADETRAKITGYVTNVIDDGSIVLINKGSVDGVQKGQIFELSTHETLVVDPSTGEHLGTFSQTRGYGRVVKVETRFSVLRPTMDPKSGRSPSSFGTTSVVDMLANIATTSKASSKFEKVTIQDIAREI